MCGVIENERDRWWSFVCVCVCVRNCVCIVVRMYFGFPPSASPTEDLCLSEYSCPVFLFFVFYSYIVVCLYNNLFTFLSACFFCLSFWPTGWHRARSTKYGSLPELHWLRGPPFHSAGRDPQCERVLSIVKYCCYFKYNFAKLTTWIFSF